MPEILDHESILQLLAPDQFLRLSVAHRVQVLAAIGPHPDPDLAQAKARAIAAVHKSHHQSHFDVPH